MPAQHSSLGACPKSTEGEVARDPLFDAAWAFILARTRANAVAFGDRLPHGTESGRYDFVEDGGWVGGFWNGILNHCFRRTHDVSFLKWQRQSWPRFVRRLGQPDSLDHDVGFLFVPSFVADHRLTDEVGPREVALLAANMLAGRFNAQGGFIPCWNVWHPGDPFSEANRGRVIVDSLYNLPLLYWAFAQTGDERFRRIAVSHAQTCARHLVRRDGTTFHTFVFDPATGKPCYGQTHQGAADDSCWARGQAWAIGGLAMAYEISRDPDLLRTACRCADVFTRALRPDAAVPWDLALEGVPGEPMDTSASAVAANGLLILARHVGSVAAADYRKRARSIADGLFKQHSTRDDPEHEGLIRHACGHRPEGRHVDASLIYGDYFFVELIARLSGDRARGWFDATL